MRRLFALVAALLITNVVYAADRMGFAVEPQTKETVLYRLVLDGGRWRIYATGEVDSSAADRLRGFAAAHKIDWAIVYFDSPGGSLIGGMRLGQAIRDLKFDTGVGALGNDNKHRYAGICASSCAYAFAGGLHRFYTGEEQRLGIHQFYGTGDNVGDIGDAQLVSGLLVAYLQKMGVNASAFSVASTTRGDSMVWLSQHDAEELGLADNGVEPPSAEIKLVGATPYLKLEQNFSDVTSRVLLSCEGGQFLIMAGIVTTPELSGMKHETLARSYLEFDSTEVLPMPGQSGASATDSVLWINRTLTLSQLRQLMSATTLGIWTENGGAFRWGATMNLNPVRSKVDEFAKNCLVASSSK